MTTQWQKYLKKLNLPDKTHSAPMEAITELQKNAFISGMSKMGDILNDMMPPDEKWANDIRFVIKTIMVEEFK